MQRSTKLTLAAFTALFLVGQVEAQSATKPSALRIIKAAIAENLKDPQSAQFRKIEQVNVPDKTIDGIYCGEVNAKNSYGGYSGFQPFMVAILGGESFVMAQAADADEADVVYTACADAKAKAESGK